MKRLALIAMFAIVGVYFVGCGVGGDSVESQNVDSSNVDSTPTLSSEDYSHLPECKSEEDRIKGCLKISNDTKYRSELRSELPFKNGKINGVVREYFADKVICEKQIADGIAVSATICFDKDGKPKNGVVKEYYDNGNLALELMFKDGRIEGVFKSYRENGNLMGETPYKNGKANGVRKVYDENGELLLENPFKDGKVNGVMKMYKYGNLEKEISYKNGKKDGEEKWYDYYDGSLRFSIVYKNDKVISGKCSDGKKIDSKKLSEFGGYNTSMLGCD